MADHGIDSKPKSRAVSARVSRRKAALGKATEKEASQPSDDLEEEDTNELTIRVKDRSSDDVVTAKRNRIGSLFKETPIKNLLKDGAGAAESLKRPLTGIFRRPGSRSGRKKEQEDDSFNQSNSSVQQYNNSGAERSASPVSYAGTSAPRVDFDAVARAPHVSSTQMHGMLQVDQLATKHPHIAKLDDLDISLLSRFLCLEDEVCDENVGWTWDYLFTSVSTEMREEWAHDENEER